MAAGRPDRDPSRFAPIFVLVAPRSYSSVIATMLGQHPELAGLPELKLFLYATLAELDASLPARLRAAGVAHRSPGLVRAVAELEFGGQTASAVRAALAWLRERRAWTGADVLDHLLDRLAPLEAVEKSPENAMSAAALERIGAAYPRARYVHLVRHPLRSAHSMAEHWRRTVPNQPLPQPISTCLGTWVLTHERINGFLGAIEPDRWLRVRAEDVLADPGPELAALARRFALDDSAPSRLAMVHPERSPFAGFGPAGSGATGGHDPGFLAAPALRPVDPPDPLDASPPTGVGEELWDEVLALASAFGYAQAGRPLAAGSR